jgi:hypothetical protein
MNKLAESTIVLILFAVGAYSALVAVMVSGWVRWSKRTQPSSALSLIGFTLATASGLFTLSSSLFEPHSPPFGLDESLLRVCDWGGMLSLAGGMLFTICGTWQPSPLRWRPCLGRSYVPVLACVFDGRMS